jgi:hypothetical protein
MEDNLKAVWTWDYFMQEKIWTKFSTLGMAVSVHHVIFA